MESINKLLVDKSMKDVDVISFRFHFRHAPHLAMLQLASRQASAASRFRVPISYWLQLQKIIPTKNNS